MVEAYSQQYRQNKGSPQPIYPKASFSLQRFLPLVGLPQSVMLFFSAHTVSKQGGLTVCVAAMLYLQNKYTSFHGFFKPPHSIYCTGMQFALVFEEKMLKIVVKRGTANLWFDAIWARLSISSHLKPMYALTLFQIFLTEDTVKNRRQENKKFFLISQLLNHENTEGNIRIYKLSPKLPSVLQS